MHSCRLRLFGLRVRSLFRAHALLTKVTWPPFLGSPARVPVPPDKADWLKCLQLFETTEACRFSIEALLVLGSSPA